MGFRLRLKRGRKHSQTRGLRLDAYLMFAKWIKDYVFHQNQTSERTIDQSLNV
jgi:hypothetical protein